MYGLKRLVEFQLVLGRCCRQETACGVSGMSRAYVPISDITTSPVALEPVLSGTGMRKDHPGCLGGVGEWIQANSSSGERLKPFTQTMKQLDPVQFYILFKKSFIELGIRRVKNRPLPPGTRRLETKDCRGRVSRIAKEELIRGHRERSKMTSDLAEGCQGGREVRPASWCPGLCTTCSREP